jgi:hypothetical protein
VGALVPPLLLELPELLLDEEPPLLLELPPDDELLPLDPLLLPPELPLDEEPPLLPELLFPELPLDEEPPLPPDEEELLAPLEPVVPTVGGTSVPVPPYGPPSGPSAPPHPMVNDAIAIVDSTQSVRIRRFSARPAKRSLNSTAVAVTSHVLLQRG